MKICPVGAKLFHVDGRTDMMKLIAIFCNYVNMPKNRYFVSEKCVTILPFGNWLIKDAWLWQIKLCFKDQLDYVY
jgi:hypothetical protein